MSDLDKLEMTFRRHARYGYDVKQPENEIARIVRDAFRNAYVEAKQPIPCYLWTVEEIEEAIDLAWEKFKATLGKPKVEQSQHFVNERDKSIRQAAVFTGRSKSATHRDINEQAAEQHRTLERERYHRNKAARHTDT